MYIDMSTQACKSTNFVPVIEEIYDVFIVKNILNPQKPQINKIKSDEEEDVINESKVL